MTAFSDLPDSAASPFRTGPSGPGQGLRQTGTAPRSFPPPLRPPGNVVTPLYGPEFAEDPYAVYERLRKFGPMAPIEVAPGVGALLITDYRAALDLFHDRVTWSRDPRGRVDKLPPDSPIVPLLGWRPHPGINDGELHRRYRAAIVHCWERLPSHELRRRVLEVADGIIAEFAAAGEADLITQYVRDQPLKIFNRLFGMPDSWGDQLVDATRRMFEADDPQEAAAGAEAYEAYHWEVLAAAKKNPGDHFPSWLLEYPAELTDEEVVAQLGLITQAGSAPLADLIGNALGRMLSDDRYYSTLSGGAFTPLDALHDVLRNDPPLANFSPFWATRDVYFHGTWVQKDQFVLVSYAACNTQNGRIPPGQAPTMRLSGGGSHLAFAAGEHMCPAQSPALLIASTAIERLTAWFSDIELTIPPDEVKWRNAPFARGILELPVRFTPISPDQAGPTPWSRGVAAPNAS